MHACRFSLSVPIAEWLTVPCVFYAQEARRVGFEAPLATPSSESGRRRALMRLLRPPYELVCRRRDRHAVAAVDRVLCNSHFSADVLTAAYGIDPVVCYLGVDESLFCPSSEVSGEAPPSPERPLQVLSVGALHPVKGHDLALRATAYAAAATSTRGQLHVVYERERPGYGSELDALARSLGVELHLHRGIPDDGLVGLYRSSRVTVCAARLEPFGLTVLESTGCGTPVVAVAQGGYRETVVDGVNGYLAERNAASVGEGIIRIVREELGTSPEALHALVSREWTWNAAAERIAQQLRLAASTPKNESGNCTSTPPELDPVKTTGCRSCGATLGRTVFDLGLVALANVYPATEEQCRNEQRYPLKVCLCEQCWLLQLEESIPPCQLFSDYAYFSSYSDTWMSHARQFAAESQDRWHLGNQSLVVEVASNDGYLLRHFVDLGIPVLGIDPAENVVPTALAAGVPTEVGFFGLELAQDLARRGLVADLVVANNVFAHVPNTNDFAAGLARILARRGHASASVARAHDNAARRPIRSDLPRARVLLLAAIDRLRPSSQRPEGHRRRATTDPWGKPPSPRVSRIGRPQGGRIGWRKTRRGARAGLGRYRCVRDVRFSRKSTSRLCALLFGAGCGRSETGRRIRCCGKRQHASQLLRSLLCGTRLRGRSQPAQTGALPARFPYPSPCPGYSPLRPSRLRDRAGVEPARRGANGPARGTRVGRILRHNDAETEGACMTISPTALPGLFLVEPELAEDERGFFSTLYTDDELAALGIDVRVAQHAVSFNHSTNTIRGLHYQEAPYAETKVVRCTAGVLFDVVADLRPGSPTRHRWIGVELSASNRKSLVIPPGCAHGYMTLTPATEVCYLISVPYVKSAQEGVRWDDPVLGISWPNTPLVIGARDATLPLLAP